MQMVEKSATDEQSSMKIIAQFVRDMSFENMFSQKDVGGEISPDVQVQVNLDAKKCTPENQFEVIVKLKIDAKSKATSAQLFLLELEYAGIFQISRIPEGQLHPFLLIECPRMLFPFIRRIVSDVTRDGGFPSLNLENINFLQLYKTEFGRKKAEQKTSEKDNERPVTPLN